MKVFLTGSPGSGKSTVLMRVIDILKKKGLKVGGFITPEIRVKGIRTGFKVVDINSNEEGILASTDQKTGPSVGKYRVNLEDFERVTLKALDFAIKECDIICVDEIGKLEFFSQKFKQKVYDIIRSDKPLIAAVHRNYAEELRNYGELIVVTRENRSEIYKTISERIIQNLRLN